MVYLPDYKDLIASIIEAMEKNGIKSKDLAGEMNVSKSVVSRMLKGDYNPSYTRMQQIVHFLNGKSSENWLERRMARDVLTADEDEPIGSAVKKMKARGYSQMPVTSKGKFIGMLSEGRIMESGGKAKRVRDAMGGEYAVMGPRSNAEEARRVLGGVQAIVVVEDGMVRGILTKTDFI